MATLDEYAKWTEEHAAVFCLRDPLDARWFELLAPKLLEFELGELRDASMALAMNPSNRKGFRQHHLEMLRSHILRRRAEKAALEEDLRERVFANARCDDCHATGVIRVPDHRHVSDGVLSRPYFIAVACNCPVGVARFNGVNAALTSAKTEQRLMDLATYEMLAGDWRLILGAFVEATKSELDAAEIATRADKTNPINVESITARMAKK